jgi:hypothetical protein
MSIFDEKFPAEIEIRKINSWRALHPVPVLHLTQDFSIGHA